MKEVSITWDEVEGSPSSADSIVKERFVLDSETVEHVSRAIVYQRDFSSAANRRTMSVFDFLISSILLEAVGAAVVAAFT
jgi:hypothetical protein